MAWKFFTKDGAEKKASPSAELAYQEFTAEVAVTAATEATANTVVTAPAVTFDGATPVFVEFDCGRLSTPAGVDAGIVVLLFDKIGAAAAASLGILTLGQIASGSGLHLPHGLVRSNKITPSAATHIFSVRSYVTNGTGYVVAGPGGPAAYAPGFIRVVKV